jgi:hypothetical protein
MPKPLPHEVTTPTIIPLDCSYARNHSPSNCSKIQAKEGGAVEAQMNVWVVWADNTLAEVTGYSRAGITDPLHPERAYYYPKEPRMRFEFKIQPASIITDYVSMRVRRTRS